MPITTETPPSLPAMQGYSVLTNTMYKPTLLALVGAWLTCGT